MFCVVCVRSRQRDRHLERSHLLFAALVFLAVAFVLVHVSSGTCECESLCFKREAISFIIK